MDESRFHDRVGGYAALIRAFLVAHPTEAFTVSELGIHLHLSGRLTREGVERLVFTGAVDVRERARPIRPERGGRRGQMPREYFRASR